MCSMLHVYALLALARSQEPLSVKLEARPGARQTFAGLGASVFPWTPAKLYNAQVTPAQTRKMARLLWHDARLRSVRVWIHPGEEPLDFYVDGYVGTGKLPAAISAGATSLVLAPDHIPPAMGDGHGLIRDDAILAYATLLADFIRGFKDRTGILIDRCGVLNEPNDRPVRFSDAQWPRMVRALRAALDARGLRQVGIVAPESANCASDAYAAVDAIRADPLAWNDLAAVATHSYNNAATEEMARRARGKEYWTTEAGGITDADEGPGDATQAASAASRFLNDVNHGVTHWQFFIGAEQADPRGNTGRILKYDVAPFRLTILQKYWSLRQLAEAFDAGAEFRHVVGSLEGEMTYTYGRKPRLNAAVARNPSGAWAIGLSNFTSDDWSAFGAAEWRQTQGGDPARTLDVTLRVPELAGTRSLRFVVRRSRIGGAAVPDGVAVMRGGVVTIPHVRPLELVTLRSASRQGR